MRLSSPSMSLSGMSTLLSITVLLFFHSRQVSSSFSSLRNRHLRVAGEYWAPFLMWECPGYGYNWETDCPNERTGYAGALWELLLFMQHATNFTFTMVHLDPHSLEWGKCLAINNCTGMVGMVNRKEVDFALGRLQKCKIWLCPRIVEAKH